MQVNIFIYGELEVLHIYYVISVDVDEIFSQIKSVSVDTHVRLFSTSLFLATPLK